MVITVSRQFAAGGGEVAERVADALGWDVLDRSLIDRVAAQTGVSADEVQRREERAPSFLERLIHYTAAELPDLFVPATGPLEDFEESKLVRATRRLIAELASRGRVVVVGRAASAILADRTDALHVRLVAPRAFRVDVATGALGIDRAAAEARLDETDLARAHYHREFYDVDWNDPIHYDLILNTGRIGSEGAVALVVARARALGW